MAATHANVTGTRSLVQSGIAKALADVRAANEEAKKARQTQVQLNSSIEGLKAAQHTAHQDTAICRKSHQC